MNNRIFTLFSIVIVIALGIPVLFRYRQTNTPRPLPAPTLGVTLAPTTNPSPVVDNPSVSSPLRNTKVVSPLIVKGTVPPGWMFEGSFPISLVDANKNVIASTQAHELVPGSWSSGQAVEFEATIPFTTTAQSGFVVLEKDNPSGLPEHAGSFEVPVMFR